MPTKPRPPTPWKPRPPQRVRTPRRPRASLAVGGLGYGAAHNAWRQRILARDPFCVDPDRRHPYEARRSTVADHRKPVRLGGTWTMENGQGLCLWCHNAKRGRESHGA